MGHESLTQIAPRHLDYERSIGGLGQRRKMTVDSERPARSDEAVAQPAQQSGLCWTRIVMKENCEAALLTQHPPSLLLLDGDRVFNAPGDRKCLEVTHHG